MKRLAAVLLLVCAWSAAAMAADRDVNAVVNAIEQQYGLRHRNMPWIARAAMKPALWGHGVSLSIKLFEDQPLPASVPVQAINELAGKALDPAWRPFIRVTSHRDGERTVIYAKPDGKRMLMLIVSAERDETTVMKMKLNASDARIWIDKPQQRGRKSKKEEIR